MEGAGYGPTFYDLVSMMAEPIPLYMGDVGLLNGQSVENLEMAGLQSTCSTCFGRRPLATSRPRSPRFWKTCCIRRVRYVQKTR